MLGPVVHLQPVTLVQRTRELPIAGQLLVRAGQDVAATDVIAEAKTRIKHYVLVVSTGLGVSEREAEQYIQREVDDELSRGDVVAQKTGMFTRYVRSPVDGRIVLISGGVIIIEVKTPEFQLLAGIPGRVADLIESRGVLIETTGALLQGLWGNGKIGQGDLVVIASEADHTLAANQIADGMAGQVLLGGYCNSAGTFARAAEVEVAGLVLGSMESELIPAAQRAPFPVILLDGFGQQPLNPVAHKFLSTSDQRTIAINAERANPEKGHRPEVFLPLPAGEHADLPIQIDTFKAGQNVRILMSPHRGTIGTLVAVLPGRTQMPNGLRTSAANVNIEDGKIIQVPLANLEILS